MAQTTQNFKRNFLANAMRMRYTKDSILPWDDNKLAHMLVGQEKIKKGDVKDFKIMNPNIREMTLLTSTSGPLEDENFLDNPFLKKILRELNLSITKKDLQKIKSHHHKIVFVGMGGAMLNAINIMTQYAFKHSELGLFEKVVVFENDTIDFTNLFRFGKLVLHKQVADYYTDFNSGQANLKLAKKLLLLDEEKFLSKERKILSFDRLLELEQARLLKKKDYILIGAPNMETRKMLSEEDIPFYFMGHGDYEVDLVYQPEAVSDLAVETYGSVDIPALLINLHIATAAFLKSLVSGEKPNRNELMFRFDIKKYLEKES